MASKKSTGADEGDFVEDNVADRVGLISNGFMIASLLFSFVCLH